VTEARQYLLASFHRFKESWDILRPIEITNWDVVQEGVTHLPMEMSIRITASLAPPAFPVTLRNAEVVCFPILLTMERTTEGQKYISTVSHDAKRDTHYNDAHPALLNA
jgi:hypothetical protein